MSGRYAIVSIGTNSTRLLLADVSGDAPHVALERTVGTRIGEGLGERGRLGAEPMARTLDAISALQRAVRGRYVRLFAIATSALRRADNGDEFLERVGDLLGVAVRVLSGEDEASASYRGAITVLGRIAPGGAGVVDAGGGSTEYAIGTGTTPEQVLSSEVGAVRLTEAFPALYGHDGPVDAATVQGARDRAREVLQPLRECDRVERVALVGGTATTTAAIVRGRSGRVAAQTLSRADLQRTFESLAAMQLDERKRVPGMRVQRADILPAGILVLDAALEAIGHDTAVATTSDLLLGYLLQRREEEPRAGAGRPARAGFEKPRGF